MIQESGTDSHCTYTDPTIVLRAAIEGLIRDLDPDEILSVSRITWMQRALTTHVIALTSKFIKGQIEHGDTIEEVDLDKEIQGEIQDLFWYLYAKTKPLKKKKK